MSSLCTKKVAPVREPVRGAEGLVALAEDGRAHVETVAVLKPLVEAPGGVVAPEEYVLGRALHGSERAYRGVEASVERIHAVVDGARGRDGGLGVGGDRDLDGCGGGDDHIARKEK